MGGGGGHHYSRVQPASRPSACNTEVRQGAGPGWGGGDMIKLFDLQDSSQTSMMEHLESFHLRLSGIPYLTSINIVRTSALYIS